VSNILLVNLVLTVFTFLPCTSFSQGNDTISGGSASDVIIGDYGRIQWVDESNTIVAIAGLGGYGDATDDIERSIYSIEVVHPPAETDNLDSGSDILYGNGERDVLIGGSGLVGEFYCMHSMTFLSNSQSLLNHFNTSQPDELYGNDGSDILSTDFITILFDTSRPNLYGTTSITSHNCSVGGGFNTAYGNEGDDILLGGGNSVDVLFGNNGNDLAVGDCSSVIFDSDHRISSIFSTSMSKGKQDNITLGAGDDYAIGGYGDDWIWGENGTNVVVGDSAEITFYENSPVIAGSLLWNVLKNVTSTGCEFSGADQLFGGDGDVDYIIGGGEVRLLLLLVFS
jgi:Ca2+-binding RTX toxin-like protein